MNPKAKSPAVVIWNSLRSLIFTQTFTVKIYSVEVSVMWTKLLMPATLSLAKFSWQRFWCVRWWWYTWWWWFYDDDNDDGDFCADAEGIKCWWWEMWDNLERLRPTQLDIFGHLWTSLDIFGHLHSMGFWSQATRILQEKHHQNKSRLNWSKNT